MKKKKKKTEPASARFGGVITALVTPFKKGRVDKGSLKKLVRQQLDGGVQGFVINGTTAESPTLNKAEVAEIFSIVKRASDGAVPLILGIGTNNTATTIDNSKLAKKFGADANLVVVPYYNKPPQRGLIEHFRAVAKKSPVPIILYNVPGRTITALSAGSVAVLAKEKNIVGIKEASGNMAIVEALVKDVKSGFLLSSGDDSSALDFIQRGGHGVISVISHVIPAEFSRLVGATRAGDPKARQQYEKFEGLNKLLGVEANPIPVKMMLYLMGVIDSPEMRLPLMPLEGENLKTVERELKTLGLI